MLKTRMRSIFRSVDDKSPDDRIADECWVSGFCTAVFCCLVVMTIIIIAAKLG
jgi:hypothetical protein